MTFKMSMSTVGDYNLDTPAAVATNWVCTLSVLVNGARATQAQFPGTGTGDAWGFQTVVVSLNVGINTVRYL